jgi:hypothetical protein
MYMLHCAHVVAIKSQRNNKMEKEAGSGETKGGRGRGEGR